MDELKSALGAVTLANLLPTVVLLLKKDAALLDEDILENSRNGIETVVKFGERIGIAK